MQKALKTLLPCNWSYTCKPRSSLGFSAVVSGNLPCYINMNLAEKSLDLLGNLYKMLSFSGQPLDLSIPPLLLMLCYIRKGWDWEQCLSCCFQNCDYQLIIVTLLLFHPFNTHCFVHTYCIPYKCLLHLKARSKSKWAEPHHNLHLFIFSVTWSTCLLICFHWKAELFLDCIPLSQIYIELFTFLPAPEDNRLG